MRVRNVCVCFFYECVFIRKPWSKILLRLVGHLVVLVVVALIVVELVWMMVVVMVMVVLAGTMPVVVGDRFHLFAVARRGKKLLSPDPGLHLTRFRIRARV